MAIAAVVAIAVPLAANADSPVFVNRLSTGSLQVSKSVTGDNPDPDKTHKVHVKLIAPEESEIPDGEWSVHAVKPLYFTDEEHSTDGSFSTDEELLTAFQDDGTPDLSHWHVGDKRAVTMTDGSAYTIVLTDADAYEKSDGSGKASFVWGFEELLGTHQRMSRSTSWGSITNSGGWNATYMREWMNGDDVYGKLPDWFKAAAKQVRVVSDKGYGTTGVTESDDYLFLPATYEVFGSQPYGMATVAPYVHQWEWYEASTNRVKKKDGSADAWWERSSNSSSGSMFASVGSLGFAGAQGADLSLGVAVSGCI